MNHTNLRIDNVNVRVRGAAPAAVRESLQGLGPELAARLGEANHGVPTQGGKPDELRSAVAARVAAALAEHLKR